MRKRIFAILTMMVLLLSACSKSGDVHKHQGSEDELQHGETHQLPNGDLQEVTASADEMPTFLEEQHENIQLVYQLAGRNTDILEWMPCYCGCGESAGHKSNLNCFISEVRKDGSIVWDDHGTRCLVCLEIALESVKLTQDGMSLKEVRDYIDNKYKEGYAKPTDTPMPS